VFILRESERRHHHHHHHQHHLHRDVLALPVFLAPRLKISFFLRRWIPPGRHEE
jgi:hypothetical protein